MWNRSKTFHPRLPAATYYWPQQHDFCIVPICNITCIIDALNILGSSVKLYKLSDNDCKNISKSSLIWQFFKHMRLVQCSIEHIEIK